MVKGRIKGGYAKNKHYGIKNHNAKMTFQDVCFARNMFKNKKMTANELAEKFRMSKTGMRYILKYKTRVDS